MAICNAPGPKSADGLPTRCVLNKGHLRKHFFVTQGVTAINLDPEGEYPEMLMFELNVRSLIEDAHRKRRLDRLARVSVDHLLEIMGNLEPNVAISFSIGGYDHDPRELWDITEARHFLIEVGILFAQRGITEGRIVPAAMDIIHAAVMREIGARVDVEGEVGSWAEKTLLQAAEFRRKMN